MSNQEIIEKLIEEDFVSVAQALADQLEDMGADMEIVFTNREFSDSCDACATAIRHMIKLGEKSDF